MKLKSPSYNKKNFSCYFNMDLMKGFLEEILDEIKKEEEKISDLKEYILKTLVFNKYFIVLYTINILTFILVAIILFFIIYKKN